MKLWEKRIFVAVAAVLLLIPVGTMPFFSTASQAEKRDLAPLPSLTENGSLNLAFFGQVGDYLADHFSFRSELVSAQSWFKGVLGVSSKDSVVMGTDEWLYFADTMPDYTGQTTLSQTAARRLQRLGDLMAEYVEGQGAKFALTVAPNKATIYPDNLPYYQPASTDPTPLEVLNQQLKNTTWYVNMTAALTAKAQDTLLYHKRDSHWNNLGARVGYNALMTAVDGAVGAYDQTPYAIQSVWDGDLDALLNPSGSYKDEQAVWQTEFAYQYTSRYRSEEDLLITTACDSGTGHLVMFRDSFGNALLPLLAQQYTTTTFSRATPYALDLTQLEKADTVIVEVVERNLTNLLSTAPKMPAPQRALPTAEKRDSGNVTATRKQSGDYTYVSGLTDGKLGMADRVYLVADGVAYEAFPIAENDAAADNGFTAYLPQETMDSPVTLMGEYNGQWIELGTIK